VLLLNRRRNKKIQAPPPRLALMIPTGANPCDIAVKTASR
jgi:hypothetical protein